MAGTTEFGILRYKNGRFAWEADALAEERRVEIHLGGALYASIMATPAGLDDLALGYLFSEGVIEAEAEVVDLKVKGLKVEVTLNRPSPGPPPRARSSGFGLGAVSLSDTAPTALSEIRLNPAPLSAVLTLDLMEEFDRLSNLFRQTGAVHSAWLIDGSNRYFAEDVGRHNALDKVIGRRLASGRSSGLTPGLILTTGRVSTEMVIKAARAGLGVLISRSSASRRAAELARRLNMILIVFARGSRLTAVSGGELLKP